MRGLDRMGLGEWKERIGYREWGWGNGGRRRSMENGAEGKGGVDGVLYRGHGQRYMRGNSSLEGQTKLKKKELWW